MKMAIACGTQQESYRERSLFPTNLGDATPSFRNIKVKKIYVYRSMLLSTRPAGHLPMTCGAPWDVSLRFVNSLHRTFALEI